MLRYSNSNFPANECINGVKWTIQVHYIQLTLFHIYICWFIPPTLEISTPFPTSIYLVRLDVLAVTKVLYENLTIVP